MHAGATKKKKKKKKERKELLDLGVGLAAVGLLAEEEADLGEELLRGTVVGDGLLGGGVDYNGEVAGGVEVVLVAEHLPRELTLLAWVPLGRDHQFEPVAAVRHEVRVLLRLAEHVRCQDIHSRSHSSETEPYCRCRSHTRPLARTCFSVGGSGGGDLDGDGGGTGEEGQRGAPAGDDGSVRCSLLLLLRLADEQLGAPNGGRRARRGGQARGRLVEEAGGGRHC